MHADEPQAWVAELERRRTVGVDMEFDAAAFASSLGERRAEPGVSAFLSRQADEGRLDRLDVLLCPGVACGRTLDRGMVRAGECPYCGSAFVDEGSEPIAAVRYRILGDSSRDIRWMIVVHGMNTRGAWQEDLSWLIANRLKYSAPVLIYKYGWATVDVLATWLHRRLARSLGERIRRAVEYARGRGLPASPDIVVHSFGSRLFSLVLLDERFSDLTFGRVITAGSVIRPDFDWTSLIRGGRIEAVLNHVGGRDWAVPLAQYLIPGTGPGGRAGYSDPAAFNQRSDDFGHSDALSSQSLHRELAASGVWYRFLTQPKGQFAPADPFRPEGWKPAWWVTRATFRLVGWTMLALLGPASLLRRTLDR